MAGAGEGVTPGRPPALFPLFAGIETLPGVGPRAASDALEQSHGSLQDWEVAMTTTADTVTVTVTGHPLSVLPGLELRVARSATLPWERVS